MTYMSCPWMYEVTKCAPQLAIKNGLNNAFARFFGGKSGFPKFHKKGVRDSFSLSSDQFKVKSNSIGGGAKPYFEKIYLQ